MSYLMLQKSTNHVFLLLISKENPNSNPKVPYVTTLVGVECVALCKPAGRTLEKKTSDSIVLALEEFSTEGDKKKQNSSFLN